MSNASHAFIQSSTDGVEIALIPREEDRRMNQIPVDELRHLYGKGFRLLQKAGLAENETLKVAPIKVMQRRPREGLRDDDITGRKVVGGASTIKKQREVSAEELYDELKKLVPSIKRFVDSNGGSASLQDVINNVVSPKLKISRRQFLTVSRFVRLDKEGLTLSEEGTHVVSRRSVAVQEESICACLRKYSSFTQWLDHVVKDFEVSHQTYERRLIEKEIRVASCLICTDRKFPDILRLIEHCRSIGDVLHDNLVRAIMITQIGTDFKPIEGIGALMLTALELDDRHFPWTSLLGQAQDPLQEIPFNSGPPTPIHIEDDSESEVLEVLDIDSNAMRYSAEFINLEE